MKSKWMIVATLALALVTLAGCCQPAQKSQTFAPQTAAGLRTSAALFGPLPLALGLEDRGYFAMTLVAAEEPLLLFDERRSYVRTEIWDLQDDLRPNISHHQMWRHAVDEGPAQR